MKKANSILWIVVAFLLLISSQSFSWDRVCIDPGHGGSDDGCSGRIYHVKEKDVNFGVGHTAWQYFGLTNWNPLMTRYEDVYRTWAQRADTANNANDGFGVDAFISIHHNAADTIPEPDTITNGTETFWCNLDSIDGLEERDTTDLLATKVYLKLRDKFHYPKRGVKLTCWAVLRLTKMASTLSEASFLTCAAVERKFYFDFEDECAKEADAIWRAGVSYLINSGIAIVRNSYSGGNSGALVVWKFDWYVEVCFEPDTVYSPYTACWLGGMFGEGYCLDAITPQWLGGHERTFHHWAHLNELGWEVETHYEPHWEFVVPFFEEDYHRYVAYFTGGYSAQVVSPDGYEIWHVGEQRDIVWNVSIGADSTTTVYIYLDRNGGNDGYPEYLGSREAKWGNSFSWTVTAPYSTHCRVKVVAEDIADNSAWDVSNYDFIISESGNNNPVIDSSLQCKYPEEECSDCIQYGEQVTIEILAHDPDGDSMYYQWFCMHGHFAENGQNTITTAQNFVTYVAPAKGKAESPANGGEGEETLFDDYISVGVTDVRGGQSFAVGQPELHDQEYTCLCGDANDDLIIDLGDVLYLISYLYKGGLPPEDPIERGDANNDCQINLGDLTYLIAYFYRGGYCPECCWFPPKQ